MYGFSKLNLGLILEFVRSFADLTIDIENFTKLVVCIENIHICIGKI